MTSTASHSATPPHGRPSPGSASGTPAPTRALSEGALPGGRLSDGTLMSEGTLPSHGALSSGEALLSHGALPDGASTERELPEGALPTGGGPWSVRGVGPGRGRAALELYQYGELTDVLVAARLTRHLLRGARHCPSTGRNRHVLAWGRLAADGAAPTVVFSGRRPFRRVRSTAEVATVAGRFWVAWAEGPFDAVRVEHPAGGTAERLPLERVRDRHRDRHRGAA
ncbi:hypothetical protein ACIQI7_11425 [Kitasatospora sp. NPDC092039]|uniref:hypothetical protein n=1 Tax=Kitasatospora sp. NPDC092039 TaxID=3364086 RepID=UPI00382DA1B8